MQLSIVGRRRGELKREGELREARHYQDQDGGSRFFLDGTCTVDYHVVMPRRCFGDSAGGDLGMCSRMI